MARKPTVLTATMVCDNQVSAVLLVGTGLVQVYQVWEILLVGTLPSIHIAVTNSNIHMDALSGGHCEMVAE